MAYFMNKFYDKDKIYRFLDELCWRPDLFSAMGHPLRKTGKTFRASQGDLPCAVEWM